MPSVTVIVATNRASPYLSEALESVRRQTIRVGAPDSVELVVVDDGSPNGSDLVAVLDQFADLSPQVIRQDPSGLQVARNVAIERSTAPYIAFLDDDDRWAPTRLADQLAPLERDPDLVACYCRFRVIDESGSEMALSDAHPAGRLETADVLADVVSIISPVMMLRRRSVERVGTFHLATAYAEDRDLSFRLAMDGPTQWVDAALVDYRRHRDSMTNRRRAQWLGTRRVLALHQDALLAAGQSELAEIVRATAVRHEMVAAREALADYRASHSLADLRWALQFRRAIVRGAGRRLRHKWGYPVRRSAR